MQKQTRFCVYAGLTAALSYTIAKVTVFPLFAAAPYLKMHLGEVPLLLVMLLGPWKLAVCALLVKEVLSFFISGSNIFGLFSDFVLVGAWLLTARLVVGRGKAPNSGKSVMLGTLAGAGVRMLLSVPVNLLVLWLQFGTPAAGVMVTMPYILSFNLIKTLLSGACVVLLYNRAGGALSEYLSKAADGKGWAGVFEKRCKAETGCAVCESQYEKENVLQ
ncbi:MAG: hypothetical protein Q4E65_05630 [Clostridia bacterium]|nr:hypothetical protein [Clostridia bacterium]